MKVAIVGYSSVHLASDIVSMLERTHISLDDIVILENDMPDYSPNKEQLQIELKSIELSIASSYSTRFVIPRTYIPKRNTPIRKSFVYKRKLFCRRY